jgi:hypothetical protein
LHGSRLIARRAPQPWVCLGNGCVLVQRQALSSAFQPVAHIAGRQGHTRQQVTGSTATSHQQPRTHISCAYHTHLAPLCACNTAEVPTPAVTVQQTPHTAQLQDLLPLLLVDVAFAGSIPQQHSRNAPAVCSHLSGVVPANFRVPATASSMVLELLVCLLPRCTCTQAPAVHLAQCGQASLFPLPRAVTLLWLPQLLSPLFMDYHQVFTQVMWPYPAPHLNRVGPCFTTSTALVMFGLTTPKPPRASPQSRWSCRPCR